MFFPPKFCHSETGSSIHLASGNLSLKICKKVDFPQPILPSIVKQYWFLLPSMLSPWVAGIVYSVL